MLEQVAAENEDRADFYEMDTDSNPEVPASLGVASIPLVVFFKGGREMARVLGGNREKFNAILRRLS